MNCLTATFAFSLCLSASAAFGGQEIYRACFLEPTAVEIAELLRKGDRGKIEAKKRFFAHVQSGACKTGFIDFEDLVPVPAESSEKSIVFEEVSTLNEKVRVVRAVIRRQPEARLGSMFFILLSYPIPLDTETGA